VQRPLPDEALKIVMRESGVRGILIYCSDYRCSHSTATSGDRWPDHLRLSDIELRFNLRGVRQAWRRCPARLAGSRALNIALSSEGNRLRDGDSKHNPITGGRMVGEASPRQGIRFLREPCPSHPRHMHRTVWHGNRGRIRLQH
jgi:hypothetical protein